MQHNNKNTGFTLLEVITAIFLITVGVLGVLTLVQQIISYTSISVSSLTATYLVQEGIEIVRNRRDANWVEGVPNWDDGLGNCSNGCEADYDDRRLSPWTAPGRYLYIDGANNFYKYITSPSGDDIETPFTRKITITPDGTDILKVLVEVEWQERGRSHSVAAQENLHNWYQ